MKFTLFIVQVFDKKEAPKRETTLKNRQTEMHTMMVKIPSLNTLLVVLLFEIHDPFNFYLDF